MKIIKRTAFILLALTIIFAGSCGRNYIISRSDKPMSEKVLKYLDNDDVERLKSMFCNITKSSPDFDEQINIAWNFLTERPQCMIL